MTYAHQPRPAIMKHPPNIVSLRRFTLWALVACSFMMAFSTLLGFTYIYHEMNTSASFIGIEGVVGADVHSQQKGGNLPGLGDPKVKAPVVPSTENSTTSMVGSFPFDLHIFSDNEANTNALKFKQLREWYRANCPCESDCKYVDHRPILSQVPRSFLGTFRSQKSDANPREGDNAAIISLLDNDALWNNETATAKCPYVIMDLGSNRGDTLQAYLNALLSSVHSPLELSPLHSSDPECKSSNTKGKKNEGGAPSYLFDLQTLSIKKRTADEVSKRYKRVHTRHQLDMESYLELHMGRLASEGDPWMDFQMQQRMGNLQQKDDKSSEALKRIIYKDQLQQNAEPRDQRPRPEQYCFYGVEGNPAFTRKLRGLELITMTGSAGQKINVRSSTPTIAGLRPLRHVHFFTETVATSSNGPAQLFVDSVSDNQVGSSLLETHKYAVMGGKKQVEVNGVTLTWLLQNVLTGFDSDNKIRGKNEKAPGHLILKIDIEGGEYEVLKEALDSLCNYAMNGNRIDLVVEFHKWVIEDKEQKKQFVRLEGDFYSKLSACGVHLTKMDIQWH